MSLLFETIRIEDGIPMHLGWHEKRMRDSGFGIRDSGDKILDAGWLDRVIRVPEEFRRGTVRCNVIFENKIVEITYRHYEPRAVKSLKLVEAAGLEYQLKYRDRSGIEALFALRDGCDDIIMVKDGFITDSSMANLIFYDGSRWVTPERPLLEGTCRARLLASGEIIREAIRVEDLGRFKGCKLINAMRWPEEQELVPSGAIRM
jgi:4-amino-4-deoxychorismate lyase